MPVPIALSTDSLPVQHRKNAKVRSPPVWPAQSRFPMDERTVARSALNGLLAQLLDINANFATNCKTNEGQIARVRHIELQVGSGMLARQSRLLILIDR